MTRAPQAPSAYAVHDLEGALLASTDDLARAQAGADATGGRACVVRDRAVCYWARGMAPGERAGALAYLRRAGIIDPAPDPQRPCATPGCPRRRAPNQTGRYCSLCAHAVRNGRRAAIDPARLNPTERFLVTAVDALDDTARELGECPDCGEPMDAHPAADESGATGS